MAIRSVLLNLFATLTVSSSSDQLALLWLLYSVRGQLAKSYGSLDCLSSLSLDWKCQSGFSIYFREKTTYWSIVEARVVRKV